MGFRMLTTFSIKFGIGRYIKALGHIVCPKEMSHFKENIRHTESNS